MSSSPVLVLDTSIILALISSTPNANEKLAAEECTEYLGGLPHASRIIVTPVMTELVYKTMVKHQRLSGLELDKNLKHFGVEFFPVSPKFEEETFKSFIEVTNKNEYDYADFFMSCVAIDLKFSKILTMDANDMSLALARAQQAMGGKGDVQLLPFPKAKVKLKK